MKYYLRTGYLTGIIGASIFFLFCTGCAGTFTSIGEHVRGVELDKVSIAEYPKASEDANIVLNLQSNVTRTAFYVDGKKVAVGRRVRVLINRRSHTVIAVPEGYISKEEFIQPPYYPDSVLSFTFLLGDKRPSEKQTSPSATKVEKPKRPKDVTPPVIKITSHDIIRGIAVVGKTSREIITGKAIDPSGIAEVAINGKVASLDAYENFSALVLLKVGKNTILVTATDTYGNEARLNFNIERSAEIVTDGNQIPDIEESKFGKYYALIIGNNEYRYIPKLQTPKNDAIEIEKVLRNRYGFTTKLLLDASRADILTTLNSFRKKLKPNDNLLIYYAGHGEFDKVAQKAYWLPVDAQSDDTTDWIIVDSITSIIKRVSSKHILIVADSCYSGTMTRAAIIDLSSNEERERYFQKMSRKFSRTLMASGGNEPVADSGSDQHSVFAVAFLRALKHIDRQVFTSEELFYGYIKESVGGRAEQTPEYNIIRNSGHDGGDFIFVRSKTSR